MAADSVPAQDAQYLSPEQFQKLTGLSPSTIRRRLADGSLGHSQPGGKGTRILIPASAAEPAPRHAAPDQPPPAPAARRREPRAAWARRLSQFPSQGDSHASQAEE